MKIFVLAIGDRSRASSRLRVWDHIEWLRSLGHEVCVDYVMQPGITRLTLNALLRIAIRYPIWVWHAFISDRVLIQEVLILSPILLFRRIFCMNKLVFDFSDPVDTVGEGFRQYCQRLLFKWMINSSNHNIVENKAYLYEFQKQGISSSQFYGPIDSERYRENAALLTNNRAANKPLRIGWTGSPGTLFFIEPLFSMLDDLAEFSDVELCLIGVTKLEYEFKYLKVHFFEWTEQLEYKLVPTFDLGLFVLDESERSKRRGAGKLFIYLSAGVPAVASAIGIARDFLAETGVGFSVESSGDWLKVLQKAIAMHEERQNMRDISFRIAEGLVSYQAYRKELAHFLLG